MTVFYVQPQNPLKSGTMIEAFSGSADRPGKVPALLVSSPQNGFPLEAQKVADTMARIMNGQTPDRLDSGETRFHYTKSSTGIVLRHRDPAGGTSREGLVITVINTASDLGQDVLARITPDLMARLCGAMEEKGNPQHSSVTPSSRPNPKL